MKKSINVGDLLLTTKEVAIDEYDGEVTYENKLLVGLVTKQFFDENNESSASEINFVLLDNLTNMMFHLPKTDDYAALNKLGFGQRGEIFSSNMLIENHNEALSLITSDSIQYQRVNLFLESLNELKNYIISNSLEKEELRWVKCIEAHKKDMKMYSDFLKTPLVKRIEDNINQETKVLTEQKLVLINKIKSDKFSDQDIHSLSDVTKKIFDVIRNIKNYQNYLPNYYEESKKNVSRAVKGFEEFNIKTKPKLIIKIEALSKFVESLNDVEIFFNQIIKDCKLNEK